MIKKNNLRFIFVSLLTVCLVSVYFGGCESENSGVEVRRDVKVAMRDGVELSANIFLPKKFEVFPELPKTGTHKIDFKNVAEMVRAKLS